jgi:hypothetical protein
MRMVATARFRYSAPLVLWTDAELDKLHAVWLQIQLAAWRPPPGYPSAPIVFSSAWGGCTEAHPVVPMIQPLAKHIEQLVALPASDELRETTIRKCKRLCDNCGCQNMKSKISSSFTGYFSTRILLQFHRIFLQFRSRALRAAPDTVATNHFGGSKLIC